MEYFDVLDENGNKTGKTKLRADVHRDGDWHTSVFIFVVNSKGEIILQQRNATRESNPNMWTASATGHVSAGDNSLSGAVRELEEELGLTVDKNQLKFLATIKEQGIPKPGFIDNEVVNIYLLNVDITIAELSIQEEEVSDVKFVHYKDFQSMVKNRDKTLVRHDEIYAKLLDALYKIFE